MLTVPPKAYLDTQIIINAESGRISSDEWERASAYLRHATLYCLSPLSLGELLLALANSDEDHFERDKRRLRLVRSPSRTPEVFDFLPYFAARQLGTQKYRPEHLEDDFVGAIGLILSAPSRKSLDSGFPHPRSRETVRIPLDRFVSQIKQLRQGYIQFMEWQRSFVQKANSRQVSDGLIPIEVWAQHVLRYHDIEPTGDLISMAAEKFSALYEHEMASLRLLRNPNFSVENNITGHVDGQQLGYLSDPCVVFLTNDSDFRKRITLSPQAQRIKSFEELLRCADTDQPIL